MTMQINIKNAATRKLADEITQRTGETITEAVTRALAARLCVLTIEERRARIDAIVEESRKNWLPLAPGEKYDDFLYDEMGMPK